MKIGRDDFEALISGRKDVASFIEMNTGTGSYSVFGVKTASNPDYLIRSIYEMYEANLERKLAVQAVRKLFRSVGMGAGGLGILLKKHGLNLMPQEFLMLVFRLQHQQGWGAPMELVEYDQRRVVLRTPHTFESEVLRDWKMPVCGLHQGWIEGVMFAVTGKNWLCSETKCHANGDAFCEFVVDQREPDWKWKAEAIVAGESAITEYLEHKPLQGSVQLIGDRVVLMPKFIFSSMMNSLKKTMGEVPAGGVNYRAYMDMGRETVEHYKKMGVTGPDLLSDMACRFYSQMGWFTIEDTGWDEERKEQTITLGHTIESEASGFTGKNVCYCTAGLLAGIAEGSLGVRVKGRQVTCRSKGDNSCTFVITKISE